MERSKQYTHLVELVARARVLAALSDSDDVSILAQNIKMHGIDSAKVLGFSEVKFNSDTVARYKELLKNTE